MTRWQIMLLNACSIGLIAASATMLLLQSLGMIQLPFNAWMLAITGILGLAGIVVTAARSYDIEKAERDAVLAREKRTSTIVGNQSHELFILRAAITLLMQRTGKTSMTFDTLDLCDIAGIGVPLVFERPHDDTFTVTIREPLSPNTSRTGRNLPPAAAVVESS